MIHYFPCYCCMLSQRIWWVRAKFHRIESGFGFALVENLNISLSWVDFGSAFHTPPVLAECMHLVNADQIERRANDVPNSQAFLCWKLSTSEKDLSFYFFFFLKYVYLKIRQQVRVFYELAKWHPTLDSIPSFYEVKIFKKIALFIKLEFTKETFGFASNYK